MLSYVRWAAACFVFVSACALSEGTDPSTLTDASAGDGGVCDPSACPGKDNECGHRGCTNNACTMNYVGAGPAPTTQIAGDCRTDSCDGKGTLASKIDDTDVPDDKNPCTKDVCTNGVPSNTAGPAGVTCGANPPPVLLCNSTGQCVGCLKPADCPGVDSECGTRTCATGGICGMNFAASGKAISSQVAGDCHVLQCDGKGTVISAVDNNDVPVDGNACTSDLCSFGTPINPPTVSGTACNVSGNTLCNGAGVCVQCLVPTTCPGGPDTFCSLRTCVSNACGFNFTGNGIATPTQTTGDCHENQCNGAGGVTNAVKPSDIPVDNNDCTSDLCSVSGVPSNPPTLAGTACNVNGKTKCNGAGVCVACVVPADCGSDTICALRTCTAGVCGVNNTTAGTWCAGSDAGIDAGESVCNCNGACLP